MTEENIIKDEDGRLTKLFYHKQKYSETLCVSEKQLGNGTLECRIKWILRTEEAKQDFFYKVANRHLTNKHYEECGCFSCSGFENNKNCYIKE